MMNQFMLMSAQKQLRQHFFRKVKYNPYLCIIYWSGGSKS